MWAELSPLLPGRSRWMAYSRMRRLGIQKTPECIVRQAQAARATVRPERLAGAEPILPDELSVSETTWQILYGSVLGDGSIKNRSDGRGTRSGYSFVERHCQEQRAYVVWKAGMMPELMPRFHERHENVKLKRGLTRKLQPELRTPTHPMFAAMREAFYGTHNRKRLISVDVDERLDVLGLLIWYLDDGHLGYKGQAACIISSLSPGILERVAARLNDRLGLTLWVRRNSAKGLVLDATSRTKLFPQWITLAGQHKLPECMMYKLDWSPPVRPQYRRETKPRRKG